MRISDWSSDVCSSDLETGKDHADAENLWLVDPIDGTKAFVRGYPIFSVQIALMQRGELVFGLSCAPCWNKGLGDVVWAEKGAGAWRGVRGTALADFERPQVSTVERPDKSAERTDGKGMCRTRRCWGT